MNKEEVCAQTLVGHSGAINCLILLTNRNGHVASGSDDKTIKIWNVENGKCLKTLRGHKDAVMGLDVLANGELVSCEWHGIVKIWDLNSKEGGSCIKTMHGHAEYSRSIQIKPQNNDSNTSRNKNEIVLCSQYGTIKTWDVNTGECIKTVQATNKRDNVEALIFI